MTVNRWVVVILSGCLAMVLATVGLLGPRALGRWTPGSASAPIATVTPTLATLLAGSPYHGTLADGFAAGAAGIVLPRAEAVPDGHLADHKLNTRAITAAEVAETLGLVQQSLIAARLGHAMLVHHDPEPYTRTLAPTYWKTWTDPGWARERAAEFYESPEFTHYATLLAPGARLAAVPRVDGRITYRAATTFAGTSATETQPWRILEVVTRFVWVYAFDAAAGSRGGIVVIRDDVAWYVPGRLSSVMLRAEPRRAPGPG